MATKDRWASLTMFDRLVFETRHGKSGNDLDPRMFRLGRNGLLQQLNKARRFVVTDAAAERLGEAMAAYPEQIALNQAFARAPFPVTWIEMPLRKVLDRPGLSPAGLDMSNADDRIGYLICDNNVTVYAEREDLRPLGMPISYDLHQPMTVAEEIRLATAFRTSRIGIDPFLWGHTLSEGLDQSTLRALRSHHRIRLPDDDIIDKVGKGAELADLVGFLYRGAAGELRNILGLLLMMNQPSHVLNFGTVPRQRGLIRNKPTPFFGHSTVDIVVDRRTRILNRPTGYGHATPRWHEVRGHFVHRGGDRRGCEHSWEFKDERHWTCGHCGRKRTWREYPEGRGSAQVGFIHQTRHVRTEQERRIDA